MSTKRKQNSRRPRSEIPGVRIIPHPGKPLKPLLTVLTDVAAAVDKALVEAGPVPAGYAMFDRAVLIRGANLLKAIVLLSGELHWEVAASSARQLFELVINMEALAAMPSREDASFRYGMFGLLQKTRAHLVRQDYERATGRAVDETSAARAAALLASPSFDTFKGKPKADGSPRWHTSWNAKSSRDMAYGSSHPLRRAQYDQLFVLWSEETHAAPGALSASMFRTRETDWTDVVLTDDRRETAQIASMALFLFLALWESLANVPRIDHDESEAWTERVSKYVQEDWSATGAAFAWGTFQPSAIS